MADYENSKKQNHVAVYCRYLDCCERLGVSGVRAVLDRMLALDDLTEMKAGI